MVRVVIPGADTAALEAAVDGAADEGVSVGVTKTVEVKVVDAELDTIELTDSGADVRVTVTVTPEPGPLRVKVRVIRPVVVVRTVMRVLSWVAPGTIMIGPPVMVRAVA